MAANVIDDWHRTPFRFGRDLNGRCDKTRAAVIAMQRTLRVELLDAASVSYARLPAVERGW